MNNKESKRAQEEADIEKLGADQLMNMGVLLRSVANPGPKGFPKESIYCKEYEAKYKEETKFTESFRHDDAVFTMNLFNGIIRDNAERCAIKMYYEMPSSYGNYGSALIAYNEEMAKSGVQEIGESSLRKTIGKLNNRIGMAYRLCRHSEIGRELIKELFDLDSVQATG